ncbi:DASH complex subunit ASK1 [Aspergillus sp. HF37]|nr:DASH complex subunit ASK1 [Aspergillus sp. HF37]
MHRMLDKTYRVQATPLGKGFEGGGGRSKFTATPRSKAHHTIPLSSSKTPLDDSPPSSPEPEAPQLNAELFSSPAKRGLATPTPRRSRRPSSSHNQRTDRGTPKPGVSVLTPAKGVGAGSAGKQPVWDSDEEFDDDDEGEGGAGPSPPKTMQFHVPQSRLMKTPAKEASKRIVSDLLASAGANDVTESVDEDQSPSVVRRFERLEDETF